jgi:UDP-N-acetylglucosamine diphosphorylase/glucosamine-1-phosphate N-acetyltransferase
MNTPLVIIMAAGLGKRMNSDLPKVLHRINDVPMIVKIVREALLLSPMRTFVVVGKYHDIIKSTIQEFIPDNQYIDYIVQDPALGTAHAVKCCIPRLLFFQDFYISYDVLVLSGDVPLITADTMRSILNGVDRVRITAATLEDAYGYGRIIQSSDGRFNKIVEDRDCSEEDRLCKKVNVGIYAFDVAVLCAYLPMVKNNNDQGEYYLTDVVEIIKDRENIDIDVFEIPADIHHEIMGVNTQEQLEHITNIYSK